MQLVRRSLLTEQAEQEISQQQRIAYYQQIKFKPERYKSYCFCFGVAFNICASNFCLGYSFVYMNTVTFATIIDVYHITINQSVALGLLTAGITIGALVGSICMGYLMRTFSRRVLFLVLNCVAFLAGLGIFIPNMWTFLVFRVIQGFCTGIYAALPPTYNKQFIPIEIYGSIATLQQVLSSFGILFSFTLYLILQLAIGEQNETQFYWVIFGFPLIILVLQSIILLFVFPYETPKYLLMHQRRNQAEQLIKLIYKQQYVEQVLNQKIQDLRHIRQVQSQGYQGTKNRVSLFLGISLGCVMVMCGNNIIVTYGTLLAQKIFPSAQHVIPVFLCSQKFVVALFASALIGKIGNRMAIQVGGFCVFGSLLIVITGFFLKYGKDSLQITEGDVVVFVGLLFFNFTFGITFGPGILNYIPQICQPKQVHIPFMFNWIASIITIVFIPIIINVLPQTNPAPIFVFFGCWVGFSIIINQIYMVETMNRTEKQIQIDFQNKKC